MANSPVKPGLQRKDSPTPHYQTFPNAKPPTSKGKLPSAAPFESRGQRSDASRTNSHVSSKANHESPLPTTQLVVLAIIALAEQTAFNSISPYLPDMASTFPEVRETTVGFYVGLIASAFALAQFTTNFFWGWLSDRVGRKPVIITGTLLTSACFLAFGFCRTLWQAILVQVFMGLVNGNQGVVSTCLGEITDRSNQSKAFTYLPIVYGIGGITGPIVGGLLVPKTAVEDAKNGEYPYLGPNILAATVLVVDLVVTIFFLEESLEDARHEAPLGRVGDLFSWIWQFVGFSTNPTYARPGSASLPSPSAVRHRSPLDVAADGSDEETEDTASYDAPHVSHNLKMKDILHRDVVLILITYFIFQLANIAYNSLYPIFAQAAPPIGRGLSPQEIGLSLGFAGLVTIVFQVGIFGRLRDKIGNKTTYRIGLGGFVVAFLLMPWIGYKGNSTGSEVLLWIELGGILIIKTIASVGGLTSALLLITNSARDHSVLGALNGLAQTLSAAGRAAGPFISGGMFSLAVGIRPKGEALAFGVFGGISFIGLLMSFGIKGGKLEDDQWNEEHGDGSVDDEEADVGDDDEDDNDNSPSRGSNERTSLLRTR